MEIELCDIKYGNFIDRFNYKFESGKITSILGKSGSGKTLISYLIMGLLKYDSGAIFVDGNKNYDKNKFLKDVGYVFQKPTEHFFCNTVSEEIGFGLKQFRFKIDKLDKQIRESLQMVGLDDSFYDRRINTLSSGESFLVALASSLVLNPKVIILDEPTVYLDYNGKKRLVKLLKKMKNRYNKSIIVLSNDISFVFEISDNYLFVDNCKMINKGNISDLVDNSNILKSFGYEVPFIIEFIYLVKENKGIELNRNLDVDDLVVDVINHV